MDVGNVVVVVVVVVVVEKLKTFCSTCWLVGKGSWRNAYLILQGRRVASLVREMFSVMSIVFFWFHRNSSAAVARQVVELGQVRPRLVQSLSACSSRARLDAERCRPTALRHFRRAHHARRLHDVVDDAAATSVGVDDYEHVAAAAEDNCVWLLPHVINTFVPNAKACHHLLLS